MNGWLAGEGFPRVVVLRKEAARRPTGEKPGTGAGGASGEGREPGPPRVEAGRRRPACAIWRPGRASGAAGVRRGSGRAGRAVGAAGLSSPPVSTERRPRAPRPPPPARSRLLFVD